MNDISPELKREWIVRALGIAGFTEKENYQGMYTQEHGMKTVVVNLNESPIEPYFNVDGKKITDDDEYETLKNVKTIIAEAEDGLMPSRTDADLVVNTGIKEGTPEQPDDAQSSQEPVQQEPEVKAPPVPTKRQLPKPAEEVELTIDIVKKYINERVTDEEAFKFIQLCKARQLNPFLGQVHLIKKEFTGTAKMVVGKEGFMERAERDPNYNGFEAGIIVTTKEKTTKDLPGAFHTNDDTLVGGWAKVYRTDRTHPIEARVLLKEYDTGKASWARMKATMIRKVPIVQAHREAFPSELSGMYDQSEIDVEVST